MNTGAELTLQIVRRVQTHAGGDVARVPHRWSFWPRGERLEWEEARALLSRVAKPVLVAPLLEPGMIGLWAADSVDAPHLDDVDQQLSRQARYFADKLTALNVDPGHVRFGADASAHQMTREEFLQWATEYALNVGVSVGPSADVGIAHVLVRPTGGGGPPLTV